MRFYFLAAFNRKSCWILLLYIFSVVNLLFMHYYILVSQNVNPQTTDGGFESISYFFNFCSSLLETSLVIFLFVIFTFGKVKRSLLLTFVVTLIWAFSNVLYSRFFQQYITLTAMTQVTSLTNSFMLECIKSGLRWFDLVFVIWGIIFFIVYKKSENVQLISFVLTIVAIPIVAYIGSFSTMYLSYTFSTPRRYINYFNYRVSQILFDERIKTLHSNLSTFHRGSVLSLDWSSLFVSYKLNEQQRKEIFQEYKNYSVRISQHTTNKEKKNIIFIIVESYLSALSDLVVDGKEITPFLNTLKHSENVYYNGNVVPNVAIGESSDGQFIYMTGILPLRTDITVTKVSYHTLPSLPQITKSVCGIKGAQMVIPTLPSLWQQKDMCETYGIEKLYSCMDYKDGEGRELTDAEVFELAEKSDATITEPFLSVILTMDMHSPYRKAVEHGFTLSDSSLPQAYKNYLITSHYTDMQIARFFEHLKKSGLFERSLIVIAADHDAHLDFLEMEGLIDSKIPVYIINGDIDKSNTWTGPCNQLDVFTTLLDVLGVKSEWHGLGHSLLFPTYQNSVSEKTWELSEWIIRGDYFKK